MDLTRRELLTGTAAVAVVAVAPSLAVAQPILMGCDFGADDRTVITLMEPDGKMLALQEYRKGIEDEIRRAFDISDILAER